MVQMLVILRSNGQKGMTKLTNAYRNCFASAPECCHYILNVSNLSESYSVTSLKLSVLEFSVVSAIRANWNYTVWCEVT